MWACRAHWFTQLVSRAPPPRCKSTSLKHSVNGSFYNLTNLINFQAARPADPIDRDVVVT